MPNINAGNISSVRLAKQASAPATPAAGFGQLYVKADGLLYWKDDGGTEHAVAVAGAAPTAHGAASHTGDVLPDASDQTLGAGTLSVTEQAAPANPAAGTRKVYVDSTTHKLSVRTSAGTSVSLEEQASTLALDDLTDVAITSPADGQFVQRVAGTFVNAYQYEWVTFVIDGGGSAITTGIKGDFRVPAGTIVAASLLADQSGSIVVDLWKDTRANFPPTVADTITAAAKPTLASATNSEDTTLTGWTTTTADGDVIRVNVDSAATVTRVSLSLKLRR